MKFTVGVLVGALIVAPLLDGARGAKKWYDRFVDVFDIDPRNENNVDDGRNTEEYN